MIRVEKVDKEQLKYIVNDYTNPSYSSIAAGIASGSVWVDEPSMPSLAVVYSKPIGGFAILGKSKSKDSYLNLCEFLNEELFSQLREQGVNEFEFSVDLKESEEILLELLKDHKMNSELEYTYQRIIPYEISEEDLKEYDFSPVDKSLLEKMKQGEINDQNLLMPHILQAWGTCERFLEKGMAYVAIHKQQVVAFILGSAYYYKKYVIDIETKEEHRKKGLAYHLTQLFTNACVDKGYVACWNCTESNKASVATVELAKFLYIKQHRYYWFDI